MVMRYFRQSLDDLYGSKIPIMNAVEVMCEMFDPAGEYLRYVHAGKRWWIESTPRWTERYDVEVLGALPKEPNRDARRRLRCGRMPGRTASAKTA